VRAILISLILIAGEVSVPDGAELVVRLERPLSSETAQVGDLVSLTVVERLRIGNCTVIAQDAAVEGRVIVARNKTFFGRDGSLDIATEQVQATDGSWVRLRHIRVKTANPATTGFSKANIAGLMWYSPVPRQNQFVFLNG